MGWFKEVDLILNLQEMRMKDHHENIPLKYNYPLQRVPANQILGQIEKTPQMTSLMDLTSTELEKIFNQNKRKYLAHVKEMLFSAERNYKQVIAPENLSKLNDSGSLIRKDYTSEEFTLFTVDNVLSPKVCEYYIKQTNQEGYKDLTNQFDKGKSTIKNH